MKYVSPAMFLSATLMAGYAAAEATVYKSVDKEGSTSFSDQPSPGAKEVEVNPNVVNVTPVKPLGPSTTPTKKAKKAKKAPAPTLKPVEVQSGTEVEYYGTTNNRQNIKKRLQNAERPVNLPAHRPILKPGQKPIQRPSNLTRPAQ